MEQSFKGLDGKVYILSPITYGDYKAIITAFQYQSLKRLSENKHVLPPDLYQEQLNFLRGFCAENLPSEKAAKAFIESEEGVALVIYLSLRHKQPHLLQNDLDKVIGPENIEEVKLALELLLKPAGETVGDSSKKKSHPAKKAKR